MILLIFIVLFVVQTSHAAEIKIAVASNFAAPIKQIATEFEYATKNTVALSFGATGKLVVQIKNGAPFDILLAADQATPKLLEQEKEAISGSQFTYAVGKLVLWSATNTLVDNNGAILKLGNFNHLAIASPKQSPYGKAAIETLTALHLLNTLTPKLVQGESIGQTYSYVATGNASLGFVALSQVCKDNHIVSGSAWIVPDNLYSPLRQDAILLNHGKDNDAAKAFLSALKSEKSQHIIRSYGYQL